MFKSLSKSRDYSCLYVEPGDSCVVAATPSPIHTHTVVVNFQCTSSTRLSIIVRKSRKGSKEERGGVATADKWG